MIRRSRRPEPRHWAIDEPCTACGRRLQCTSEIPLDRLREVHRAYGCRS